MKGLHSLKGEFRQIFTNKTLMIAVMAVLFIPVLYCGTFLWAFWDPYGQVDQLPVAVVNNDKGADFNGEDLTIGKDFVEDLRENDTFDWRFVDEEEADRGLEKRDYYLKIEIPEDFSENATTLEDVHPEKLELIYSANQGSNYLSSKIGDSAIEKIKEEVSGAVTKTYAESMFDQIKEVGNGLTEASDGAGELNDKLGDATSGSADLHAGIDSAQEGANKLSDGLGDAASGANKLDGGVGSVAAGANKLENGVNSAQSGAGALKENIGKAQSGAKDLNGGINSVNNGAQTLSEKLQELAGKSTSFSTGVDTAYAGAKKVSDGLHSFDAALTQMTEGNQELLTGANKSQEGAQDLADGLHQSLEGLTGMNDNLPDLAADSQKVADESKAISGKAAEINSGLNGADTGSAEVSQGLEEAMANVDALIEQEQDPAQKERLNDLKASMSGLTSKSQNVKENVSHVSGTASALESQSTELSALSKVLAGKQSELTGGFNKITKSQAGLANGADSLLDGQNLLVNGLSQVEEKISDAQKGINHLINGSTDLTTGLGKLDNGTDALQEGSAKLAKGSSDLADGTSRLSSGSNQLVNGLDGLYDGSGELYTGLGDLSKGSNDLTEGLGMFSSKFKELMSGLGEMRNGSTSLSSGLGKLSDGSTDLTDGLNKLTDGSSELKNKLADGAEDANDINANDDIYDMFAKPVSLTDKPIHDVPNYGTGFAPYFLSLSLFVGALVISIIFPMREPAVTPQSGFGWFFGKFGVLMFAGIFQALLADSILLWGLGLEVTSIPLFIMMSILASWTFLSIVQFLVTSLDNPGRFIGILILILQLTSSAGTYPIELVPEFLQHFSNFLPMTYTISAFRAIISTGDDAFMWHNVMLTLIFLFVAMGGTILYLTFRFRILRRKHHREIEA
jgi:putative membrane protein